MAFRKGLDDISIFIMASSNNTVLPLPVGAARPKMCRQLIMVKKMREGIERGLPLTTCKGGVTVGSQS